MGKFARIAFKVARSELSGPLVRFAFSRCSWALPIRRVREDTSTLSFRHPRPMEPGHLLVVPKAPIATLVQLTSSAWQRARYDLLVALRDTAVTAERKHGTPVLLFANGGSRQDVGLVHWHITFQHELLDRPAPLDSWEALDEHCEVVATSSTRWRVHLLLRPRKRLPPFQCLSDADVAELASMLTCLPALDSRFRLTELGYALCFAPGFDSREEDLVVHIVAGESTTAR
jgi:diadenosine tetraphosphate (Ap4A) HIT family hydrolase